MSSAARTRCIAATIFVIGLVVLFLNSYLVNALGDVIKRAQQRKNAHADVRVSLVNEALQGARTVKLYSWEEVMQQRVAAKRAAELVELRLAPDKLATAK